jgi:hypothetical protein
METGRVRFVVEKRANNRHYLRIVGQWPGDMGSREALLYSIQKWETIEQAHLAGMIGPVVGNHSPTCALCHLYDDAPDCEGCPVVGGHPERLGCSFTPIETYIWARSSGHNHDHYARLAHNVVEFGYSLLRKMEEDENAENE